MYPIHLRVRDRTRPLLAAFAVVSAVLASLLPVPAQTLPDDLLTEAPPPSDDVVKELLEPQVERLGFVFAEIDRIGGPGRLEGALALRLRLFDDVDLVAVRDRIERRAPDRYTWFGRVADDRESQVLLIVRGDALTAKIITSESYYEIVALDRDAQHAVREIDRDAFLPEEPDDTPEIPVGASAATAADVLAAVCGDDDFVDVLVVYTADADAAPGDILGEVRAAIDDTNQSYENSGITQRLRLVGAEQVDYVESGDAPTDRNRLKDPGDGFLDGVHAMRDDVGADLVSLWTRTSNYCGYAYIMQTVDVSFEEFGFNVVTLSCAVGNHSFAHELGHNMSARHDRYVDGTDGSPFSYNHGYVDVAEGWRTIMSYNDACEDAATSCTRLQYWSNPGVSYLGDPTGIADGDPDAADNHSTLESTRTTVQQFRAAEAPTADAGPDVVAECGIPTELDGSGSCDPQDDALGYAWTGAFEEGGGTAAGVMPSVTFPKGVHPVTLVVDDGSIASVPDTVLVDATTDATEPAIECPADVTVSCTDPTDPGETGSATAEDLCDVDPTIDFSDEETPGDCPQEKTITRTWTATDDDGNVGDCAQTITVDDSVAPTVTCGVEVDLLWPPRHQFVDVGFSFEASDDCDEELTYAIDVTSDEHPATALGAGGPRHCPDAVVDQETGSVLLRAERAGVADGRVYVVTVTATDACGNASSCSAEVTVPKNRGHRGAAIDSGQAFDAATCDGVEDGAVLDRRDRPEARSGRPFDAPRRGEEDPAGRPTRSRPNRR